jgi:hypothetical protein
MRVQLRIKAAEIQFLRFLAVIFNNLDGFNRSQNNQCVRKGTYFDNKQIVEN